MHNYRLAVDENGSPFVLNSKGSIDFGYITEEMNLLEKGDSYHNTLFIALSKEGEYWKVISGGVFNLRYSKKKKEIYSGSDNRPPQPAPDDEGLSLSKM